MRLILITTIIMVAFAANSVLGRWGIGGGYMRAEPFGLLRLASGAVMLWILCGLQGVRPSETRLNSLLGGASLLVYILGFSVAYAALDAGLGALVMFGTVQITMFAWGLYSGDKTTSVQLSGAGVALAGLAYVVWPSNEVSAPLWAVVLMMLGGVGWGVYSLVGRRSADALGATTLSFTLAALVMVPVVLLTWDAGAPVSWQGVVLAVISGAVTSAVGYAAWYRIIPQLSGPVAATVQLSVPVIAILAGSVILGEAIGLRLLFGSVVVLGGIALVILAKPAR